MEHQSFFTPVASIVAAALADFYEPMAPWLLLAVALIVTDLRFGTMAARKRGELVRHSRMWRRTIAKTFDYFCWVTVAGLCGRSIGVVLGVPVVSMGLLVIIYGIELSSCVNNYFEYKGINKRFNFWKLIHRPEIENAVEDTEGGKA